MSNSRSSQRKALRSARSVSLGAVYNQPNLERPSGVNRIPTGQRPGFIYFDRVSRYPKKGEILQNNVFFVRPTTMKRVAHSVVAIISMPRRHEILRKAESAWRLGSCWTSDLRGFFAIKNFRGVRPALARFGQPHIKTEVATRAEGLFACCIHRFCRIL
jgi:hypothetical protein